MGENMYELKVLKNKYKDYVNTLKGSNIEKNKLNNSIHIIEKEYKENLIFQKKQLLSIYENVNDSLYLDELNLYEDWLVNGRFL